MDAFNPARANERKYLRWYEKHEGVKPLNGTWLLQGSDEDGAFFILLTAQLRTLVAPVECIQSVTVCRLADHAALAEAAKVQG